MHPPQRCQLTAVSFDFEAKQECPVALSQIAGEAAAGRFVWLDVLAADVDEARTLLSDSGLLSETVLEDALTGEALTRHARYDDFLHLVVSGCRVIGDELELERVDVVVGEHLLVTLHRAPVLFLDALRRDYRADFIRFARSPSFLVYELWDHLLENYLEVQHGMEERVEALQRELSQARVDDSVFARISNLGSDLLHFRKILLPARAVLAELSTRKTAFINEATQGFLHNMVGTVDHLLQDLLVDRDILSESLYLYMSVVTHRTNLTMKRLTTVSVVFLPLTFLVGVYGMNFEVMPELRWQYGYLYFWVICLILVGGLVFLLRRSRML